MNSRIHPSLIAIALLLCGLAPIVQADEPERLLQQDSDGFCVTLRNVSEITLTQHLQELQQDLKNQVVLLKEEVQRKSFKTIDTLITVVMPGGLIYAKLRLDSYKRSQHAMTLANEELTQISQDLDTFQSSEAVLVLANAE